MKELKWKIIKWCVMPAVLGLLVIGVAWYNYANPPLSIAGQPLSRLKFKLGVDLVGGTILVYEIDPDKKPESYDKDQLINALKKRLDPADLYNITIRPLSDTRVEIILPTGGRHRMEAEKHAWEELLDATARKWADKGVKREELHARRGDTQELSEAIRTLSGQVVTGEEIAAFLKENWGDREQSLTGDDVERIKDMIQRVGSLEFRILANTNDDKDAIAAAAKYFDEAAKSWADFTRAARTQYPEIEKPAEGDETTIDDIAAGDKAGVIELIRKRRPKEDPRGIEQWVTANLRPNEQLADLMKRADSGAPPAPPLGPDGRRFRFTNEEGEQQTTYSWVELGKNELHSLKLNNEAAKDSPTWSAVARARSRGELYGDSAGEAPVLGSSSFRVPVYSRRITNPGRLLPKDRDKRIEYFFLTRDPQPGQAVTGEHLSSAREGTDPSGRLAVDFRFNARGAALFYDLTRANVPPATDREGRRHLSIILDGLIMSAPSVNSAIRDSGQISGSFTRVEVDALVNILRAGALPATLKPQPVSENTMGSTLGDDTVRKGTLSIALAFCAVLAFMLIYYRFAGLVACIALLVNLILTIAFMVAVNATFTLPGLSGLVLMLAMAVDANILIYERLREERERGASLSVALRNGYDRAFPTIIDTHLTSICTAIVLYVVGNDQLKGFGISLTVGLIISLYTSLYMTKLFFRFWEAKGWLKKLSMAKLLSKPNFDFMRIRKPMFAATVLLAVAGVALFLARGKGSLNMDFVGGTVYSGELTQQMDIDKLRERLVDEDRQRSLLALERDPEPVDDKGRVWNLVYREGSGEEKVREVRMTETVTAAEVRRRAEALPDPSLELIFTGSEDLSSGNESKLFTVRTTEKSPDLVAASISRLLGDELKRTRLKDYTIRQVTVVFSKPVTIEQARAAVLPALREARLAEGVTAKERDLAVALKAVPVASGPLAAALSGHLAGDEVKFTGQEQGVQSGTYKTVSLTFKEPADGNELLAALAPLTEADAASKKEKQLDVQVSEVQLNLSDYTYLAQVKTLLDEQLKGLVTQEIQLREVDRRDEQEGRFNRIALSLPAPVDAGRFRAAMTRFANNLANRPLPVRLENFDSALAADMQKRALYAIVASWAVMLLYLWFRFGNWTFGLAAVVCLVHDVCFTLGLIAVCHYLYGAFGPVLGISDFKIDLPAVAALLTLIGFSVNDTIVVFDRVREVRGKNPNLTPEMINESINQTLSRTILTSLTAWLVVLVLYVGGGEGVHLFAFVMVVGVVIGTLSSIFVASPMLLLLGEGAPRQPAGQLTQRAREEKPAGA